MALLLREEEVRSLVDINDALEAVEVAFRELAAGRAKNQPRRRVAGTGTTLAIMSAFFPPGNLVGYKAYTAGRAGARFLLHLFDQAEGRLLAVIEADWLGALRTGAVSGLASRILARADASVLTLFGAGHQALPQAIAIAAVRPLTEVRIVNRDPERRARLGEELQRTLPGIRVVGGVRAEEAIAGAGIITTITSAGSPLFNGDLLQPGQHLNAAGSNNPGRRELDSRSVGRASLVVVDELEAARLEAGDLLLAEKELALDWQSVSPLAELVRGPFSRSASDITLFKSVGLAIEDVALGAVVLQRAGERGAGRQIDL